MAKQQLQALHHCVFSLHFHLVLVTKYRRKAITRAMLERLRVIFQETLEKWGSELIEFNGEADHSRIYWKPVFWHRSYCLISAGGATIETLRKYIEEQGGD